MPQRNHVIDLARVGSMLVVVIFHTLLWQVLLIDGHIEVIPWAPGPTWWAISWVATIIPVFFVAAGYANAVVVDRWRESGANYAGFLILRGSRLLGPLTLFISAFAGFGSIAAWLGWVEQASILSRQFAQLLWFAVVYVLLLAAAPLALYLHDRFGGWVMLPLLVGVVAVDAAVRMSGHLELQWLNLSFVWPLAHQWGIAYHRGWFRGWRTAAAFGVLAGGAAILWWLVGGLGYPASVVAWADIPVANLLPPTLAAAVLGLCQTAALALVEKSGIVDRLGDRAQRLVRTANALLLTVYLWHIPAIVASAAVLAGLSLLFPGAAAVLLNPLLLITLVLATVVVAVPRLARVELRLIPHPGSGQAHTLTSVLAFGVFASGTWAVWQQGALLHPADPGASIALMWFLAGGWLLRRATLATAG